MIPLLMALFFCTILSSSPRTYRAIIVSQLLPVTGQRVGKTFCVVATLFMFDKIREVLDNRYSEHRSNTGTEYDVA